MANRRSLFVRCLLGIPKKPPPDAKYRPASIWVLTRLAATIFSESSFSNRLPHQQGQLAPTSPVMTISPRSGAVRRLVRHRAAVWTAVKLGSGLAEAHPQTEIGFVHDVLGGREATVKAFSV